MLTNPLPLKSVLILSLHLHHGCPRWYFLFRPNTEMYTVILCPTSYDHFYST